ncbi:hypothetical protein [Bombilactobacillus apium]|nr:hypothetical protein [Bombilactobacillus apium]
MGVAKSTISYELQGVQPYDPELAQAEADRKRRHCGPQIKSNPTT